jgi:hypothetical protein
MIEMVESSSISSLLIPENSMKNIYGEVIIKKNSILYHTSEEIFSYKNYTEKPMLFCTFHPSEWDGINDYVTFIKLKRDISLLFMIEKFKKKYIFSSLSSFINNKNENLAKKYNSNLYCFVNELKHENFDGWFTSIENKSTVEVSLINNLDLFETIKTEELRRNWRNANNLNNIITIKNWGKKYPICSIKKNIIFKLNERYKKMIEDYINYGLKSDFPYDNVLNIIFDNAEFYYSKYESKYQIKWQC